jgi:hypothetical protein
MLQTLPHSVVFNELKKLTAQPVPPRRQNGFKIDEKK